VTDTGSADVARYYDSNTGRFLRFGSGRGVHAMHRELWGPEARTANDASDHVNRLLAHELADLASADDATVVDFGCGVGGTLFRLADALPDARLVGLTVSPRQRELAESLAAELGHADRCEIVVGDFEVADLEVEADAIIAVEAFAHSASAPAFMANASRHLRPGGRLIVVDDFLATDETTLGARERRQLERFRAGWRVPAVCTVDGLERVAAERGLEPEKRMDLTPLTRPGRRVRDRAIAVVAPLLAALGLTGIPACGNLIGGNALQIGLREGFVRYALVALRKPA
jgi:SAM-dependent methyltransferase